MRELALKATIVKTLDEIRALESQWAKLTPPSPFSSWDYAYHWLRCAPEAQAHVIAVHSRGELVGVAPWCLSRDYAGSRVLTGIGKESAWYHDPLIVPGYDASRVFQAIGEALCHRKWDAIDLTLQTEHSLPLITELKRLGMTVTQRASEQQSHVLAFEDDWEACWKRFPSSFRKGVRRLNRHLESIPHRYLQAPQAHALEWIEDVIALNRTRWNTGENWELTYAVMRANTPTLLAQGDLRLYGLEIEGRMAALAYHIRKGNRSFALIGNYHPDFAEYSPSNLLLHWLLTQLHQEGVRWVDLGPGEYDYKNRIQSGLVETVRTQVGTSLLGMALVGWRGMIKARASAPQKQYNFIN
ncbi:hypothetical protein D3C86_520030 [compost metagenome]